jgi:golgi-specific brefeldin A-resistance guanine nucleotide exchange factor 1
MSELRQALLSEASSLLSSVRRNPSWAASELGAAAPAIVGLEAMRHRLMDHRAGPQQKSSQLALLLPLLDVVRSAELSAPFTTCALHALHRIVLQKLVRRDAPDARPALAAVVAAVSKCQFETTDTDNNELAISAVFAVLLSTLRTSAALLDDAAVGEMVQACFRLNQRQVPISALLRGQAEATFVQLAHAVFAGLLDLHGSDAPPAYEMASASAGHSVAVVTTAAAAPLPPPSAPDSHVAAGLPCIEKLLRFLCHELRKPLPTPAGGADTPRRSAAAAAATTHSEEVSNALAPKLLCLTALIHGLGDMREELSLYPTLMACVGDDMCEALLQLLRFCAAEALAVDGGSTDQLAQVGQAAAAEMAELQAGVLARCLQLVRLLWSTTPLRDHLVVQLEVIFNSIFLRVLGPAGRQEHEEENVVSHLEVAQRRAILECLMDMLNEPVALVHMYAMFDCDMARTDVLENMFRLLSETVSARAISLARRGGRGGSGGGSGGSGGGGGGGSDADTHGSIEPAELAAQVEEEEVLRVLPLQCLCAGLRSLHHVIVEDEAAAAESNGPRADSLPEGALSAHDLSSLKFRKSALCKGALFFNEKSRDGYKELQRLGVLPAPLQPGMVAEFLRGLPSLDKKAVGCYLGESGVMEERVKETTYCTDKASFHASVLDSFVSTFDLSGLSLLASLRTFLSSFRLPGEAQQIDRILVAFSEAAFTQCSDCHLLASSDVAYVLSFSIIMLNTDLHNVNIKEEKKMSLKDFYRNNKNYGADVSKGIDLPEDFLTGIYNGIKTFPFRTLKDGPEGEITPERWGDLLRMNAVMRAAENSIFKRPATTDWSAAAAVYTPQIFALIWSPALAAFSSCMQPGAAGADKIMPVVRSGFAMCTQLSSHFGLQVSAIGSASAATATTGAVANPLLDLVAHLLCVCTLCVSVSGHLGSNCYLAVQLFSAAVACQGRNGGQ